MDADSTRFLADTHPIWRTLFWISRPFAKRATASDRNWERTAADMTEDGLGPDATVEGREWATNMLAYFFPVITTVAWFSVLACTLVVRSVWGPGLAEAASTVTFILLFPFFGLVIPFSWRFWLAQRQLKSWRRRGEPEDERPSERSLPRTSDVVVGLTTGAVIPVLMVVGMFQQ